MTMSAYRLKGCPAEKINNLVIQFDRYSQFYTEAEYNRRYEMYVDNLTYHVVNKYTIKECISLISANGDFLDAIKKSIGVQLDMTDTLKFHRQLASPYIKNWIKDKINVKLFLMKKKRDIEYNPQDNTCSICLDVINPMAMKITKCGHLYHRECLNKWGKNTCPMCRNNI